MTAIDQRPDPNTVGHEAVATVARQRVLSLTEEVLLRDAKISEQHQYIQRLESRVTELEQQPVPDAGPRGALPRHTGDQPTPGPAPQAE